MLDLIKLRVESDGYSTRIAICSSLRRYIILVVGILDSGKSRIVVQVLNGLFRFAAELKAWL